jgi:Tfp pilus assembly protein PilF/flagellar basal body-associated protein FliL
VGLITKAIKKVEQKENPPVQQEEPPQPKKKNKLVILIVTLILIVISLGLGYFLLLKPAPEVPPKKIRRTISARRKPAKSKPEKSYQKKDAETAMVLAEGEPTASENILEKKAIPQEEAIKAGVALEQKDQTPGSEIKPTVESQISEGKKEKKVESSSEQKKETTPPEIEPDDKTIQSQVYIPEKETAIPESDIEESPQLTIASKSNEEKEMSPHAIPPQEEKKSSLENTLDKTSPFEGEEKPEEAPLSYASDLKDWLAQMPLSITERSDSKAQRYYNKGVSYQEQGKVEKAIDSYKKALNFNPDLMPAHLNLATAYLHLGRFKEAEQKLIYLYALKPTDCKVLYNFGLLLYQSQELASAENKLKTLLALDPLHLEGNLLMGSVYEEKGEIYRAINCFMKAYHINSVDPGVLYRLGRAWDLAGEPMKAVEYYRSFLNTPRQKEKGLESAVRDRLNYLILQQEVGNE